MSNLKWVFFGTSEVSVAVLDDLKEAGFLPSLIVCPPDKPQGRKFIVTPPFAKVWGIKNNIGVLQPEKIDEAFAAELEKQEWDLFIVVAYGKIIPKRILDLPKHKSLNVHYSLLPKLRGSSPVEGAILNDEKETGVSIIVMDEKMDHGPVVAQEKVELAQWPITRTELMNRMNAIAGKLLANLIPKWIRGEIIPIEQDHEKATFVKMIKKEDGLLDLSDEPYLNYKKIMAYERWPRTYFIENGKRIIINKARLDGSKLEILRVTPEGRNEMDYRDYQKSA